MKIKYALLFLTLNLIAVVSFASNIAQSDAYNAGYIQSIFVHSYGFPKSLITVEEGQVIVDEEKLNGNDPAQIFEKVKLSTLDLKDIKGVSWKKDYDNNNITKAGLPKTGKKEAFADVAMPNNSLFQPLIADPKWPRFTVAYQHYVKDGMIKHAFAPNFGASFPLYRIISRTSYDKWEIGIQAGLFGIMDIGTNPTALVNADYFIGVPITYSSGPWSGLARFYHISSHLGDEYMLTPKGKKTKRINLSYEGIDVLLSRNFNSLRLYGGGGYLVHKEPSYIKPLKVQAGMEYYFNRTFLQGRFRPVIGIDLKADENAKWYLGTSCKAGVQFENPVFISNKVQLMLEFYSGKSIHGQFYNDKVRYVGIGLQAFL